MLACQSDKLSIYEPGGNRSVEGSPVRWVEGSTHCSEVVLQYFANPTEVLRPRMVGSSYEASADPVASAVVVRLGKRVFGILLGLFRSAWLFQPGRQVAYLSSRGQALSKSSPSHPVSYESGLARKHRRS